jgi:hypothetical protein
MIDIILDYFRLVSYGMVILTSLKGIYNRKFTSLLFLGDIVLAVGLVGALVILHLFEVVPSSTIIDDIFLTLGAVIWAVIHFVAMLKE